MTKNIGGDRALRVCDLCGGVDDHPRHVIAGDTRETFAAPAEDIVQKVLEEAPEDQRSKLVRDLFDTTSSDRHMDCCREAGCPTGDCERTTQGAEDKRGAALLKHLREQ